MKVFKPKLNIISSVYFDCGGEKVSVADYFVTKYNTSLKYKSLPLVVERTSRGKNYFPIEVLEIERGQRVMTEKSTPQMVIELYA